MPENDIRGRKMKGRRDVVGESTRAVGNIREAIRRGEGERDKKLIS